MIVRKLNYNKYLLLTGFFFTLHNIEESVGFAYFTYPQNISLPFCPPSKMQMILSIVILTVIVWGIFLFAFYQKNEIIKRNILAIFSVGLLFNAIVPHIAATIFLQRYTPAVVTSAVLYIPFTLYVIHRLYRSFLKAKEFFITVVSGMIILILLVQLTQYLMSCIF
ncbi:MAG: HXXEE domain-containing protein [Lentimicrobiaceae bacterium]|nr:HXXEE domain-containing protein [Lentimicrobiaceae bacterium]